MRGQIATGIAVPRAHPQLCQEPTLARYAVYNRANRLIGLVWALDARNAVTEGRRQNVDAVRATRESW